VRRSGDRREPWSEGKEASKRRGRGATSGSDDTREARPTKRSEGGLAKERLVIKKSPVSDGNFETDPLVVSKMTVSVNLICNIVTAE
jgi:hypothetical protein